MSKISQQDLESLKSLAENAQQDWEYTNVNARSSAYMSIETIRQLKTATKNNIMFTILGAVLGFISSISVAIYTKSDIDKDLQELHTQMRELKVQVAHFHTYQSKKDSLKTSSKKN